MYEPNLVQRQQKNQFKHQWKDIKKMQQVSPKEPPQNNREVEPGDKKNDK